MKNLKLILIPVLTIGLFSHLLANYSGSVKDASGSALSGAVVSLKSDSNIKDTTAANGEFSLITSTSIGGNYKSFAAVGSLSKIEMQNKQLMFSLREFITRGNIQVISGAGEFIHQINFSQLAKGTHAYDLPVLPSGLYIIYLNLDETNIALKTLSAGGGRYFLGGGGSTTSSLTALRKAAAVDSLLVEKEGYETLSYALESEEESNIEIVMVKSLTLPPVTDYSAMGPHTVVTETGTGPDGSYTIFRPSTLGENGFLHAPIIFGPGTGMQVSQMSNFLTRIASHGFVVISRQLDGGPGSAQTRQRLTDGLDWIIEQNSVSGSDYEGKLAVTRAVTMGYSVGATGSIEIGGHEALATVVAIHGHTAEGDLHTPVLMIGGTNDLNNGVSWMAPSYEASQVQTFFGMMGGAGHGYIQETVNGVQGRDETPAIIAWIRYWVYNDKGAKHFFYGDDCVMCTAPWAEPQRKFWDE